MSPAAAAARLYDRVRGVAVDRRRLRAVKKLGPGTAAPKRAATATPARRSVAANAHLAGHSARGAVAQVRTRTRETTALSIRTLVIEVVVLVALAVGLVWVRLQVVDVGYELSTGRQIQHRLEQEQRELALEIATLTSPRRLELNARRLGMRPPAAGQIITAP